MEHKAGYTAASMIGGSLCAAWNNIQNLLYTQAPYSFEIDWAETFQICWKAGVGAAVGLVVKSIWDSIVRAIKRRMHKKHSIIKK